MVTLNPHSFPEPDTQRALLINRQSKFDWAPLIQAISDRFETYRKGLPAIDRVPKSPPLVMQHETDLAAIYESQAKSAKAIRKAVRNLHQTKCPYCGEPGSPTNIDHFLPRSEFAEFAFFSTNLVPSCDRCNQRKKAKIWENDTGVRRFLNPYVDNFLGQPFFYLLIQKDSVWDYNVPIFHVVWDSQYVRNQRDRDRCESHFLALDIINRARTFVLHRCNYLRHKWRPSVQASTLDVPTLRTELEASHAAEVAVGAVNSWDAVTYRSILRSTSYLNFFCNVPIQPSAQ